MTPIFLGTYKQSAHDLLLNSDLCVHNIHLFFWNSSCNFSKILYLLLSNVFLLQMVVCFNEIYCSLIRSKFIFYPFWIKTKAYFSLPIPHWYRYCVDARERLTFVLQLSVSLWDDIGLFLCKSASVPEVIPLALFYLPDVPKRTG